MLNSCKSRPIASLVLVLTLFTGCTCGTVNVITNDGATANMTINGLASLASKQQNQYVTVTFTGTLTKKGDGSGSTSLNTSREFEIDPSGNINPSTTLTVNGLQPGTWSVTAQLNQWIATCSADLSKGGSGTFTFTCNMPGCTTK